MLAYLDLSNLYSFAAAMGNGDATGLGDRYYKRSKISTVEKSRGRESLTLNMDGLGDNLLIEILCRLPCNRFVFQCKCVCQRWRILLSDPYFVGRLLRLQSNRSSPIRGSLINLEAETFTLDDEDEPLRFSLNFLPLGVENPIVVATYNDLALCCPRELYPRDYYICNLYTKQYVALPLAPDQRNPDDFVGNHFTCRNPLIPVGFICEPCYKHDEEEEVGGDGVIKVNADYKCRVVRFSAPPLHQRRSSILNIEIFSSEIGEWRELALSTPRAFHYDVNFDTCFTYHGLLYWENCLDELFIGLDLLAINLEKNDDSRKCHFAEFDGQQPEPVENRGCMRVCDWWYRSDTVSVWYLK